MEKLIKDLIERINAKKLKDAEIFKSMDNDEKKIIYIYLGKLFAYDYCLQELKRILEFNETSKININK